MNASKTLVLVTGVTGYVASHIVPQLFEAGFSVRGYTRQKRLYASTSLKLELVAVDDIATGDLSVALKDVGAVIHVASPLPMSQAPTELLRSAVQGTLNVLEQTRKAGIHKVVITSSMSVVIPNLEEGFTGKTWSPDDWVDIDESQILIGDKSSQFAYAAGKNLAEKAAWKFADQHPEMEISTNHSPLIVGPLRPEWPTPAKTSLGTNYLIYQLLSGEDVLPCPPIFIDVRDVARAHVLALSLPKYTSNPREHRFFTHSEELMEWKDAAAYLREKEPKVAGRLKDQEVYDNIVLPGPASTIDAKKARDVLGMIDYISWKQSLSDSIPSFLEAEKVWNSSNAAA
ncbi:hypothetical protein DL96DRAFT_1703689 [Flagelloscypha sp. PMI_526]|nr:hypothetical protein DL96DRAFT_1703689 [Flagelloscypha sp. PMI_526]